MDIHISKNGQIIELLTSDRIRIEAHFHIYIYIHGLSISRNTEVIIRQFVWQVFLSSRQKGVEERSQEDKAYDG